MYKANASEPLAAIKEYSTFELPMQDVKDILITNNMFK